MSMRISDLVFLAAAVACTGCAPVSELAQGESIDCALGEGADWAPDCILEPIDQDLFVIHHPDGSSYRYRFTDRARSAVTSDGAEPMIALYVERSSLGSGADRAMIQFSSQGFRYRFDPDDIPTALDE
ncbi:MAG: hypothetical protein AAGH57_08465 [Pseudomonadota bacterium]